ncbi:MAG: hypothetical protein ABFD52_10640 [Acidobacteriota bacterium]
MPNKQEPILPRLPFPTRTTGQGGKPVEEYVIPEEEKAWVLDGLYPFEPVPGLEELMFDLHEEKEFRVGDFRVVRGEVMDLLVSPYYLESGGTVLDWMPAGFRPGETLTRQVRGESYSIVTVSLGPRQKCH